MFNREKCSKCHKTSICNDTHVGTLEAPLGPEANRQYILTIIQKL